MKVIFTPYDDPGLIAHFGVIKAMLPLPLVFLVPELAEALRCGTASHVFVEAKKKETGHAEHLAFAMLHARQKAERFASDLIICCMAFEDYLETTVSNMSEHVPGGSYFSEHTCFQYELGDEGNFYEIEPLGTLRKLGAKRRQMLMCPN